MISFADLQIVLKPIFWINIRELLVSLWIISKIPIVSSLITGFVSYGIALLYIGFNNRKKYSKFQGKYDCYSYNESNRNRGSLEATGEIEYKRENKLELRVTYDTEIKKEGYKRFASTHEWVNSLDFDNDEVVDETKRIEYNNLFAAVKKNASLSVEELNKIVTDKKKELIKDNPDIIYTPDIDQYKGTILMASENYGIAGFRFTNKGRYEIGSKEVMVINDDEIMIRPYGENIRGDGNQILVRKSKS